MAKSPSGKKKVVLRFTLSTAGPARPERDLKKEVAAAQKEALADLRKPKVNGTAEPEGGFLGAGIDWFWLLHVSVPYLKAAGEGVAAVVAQDLYKYLKKALLKRNIIASETAEDVQKARTEQRKKKKRGRSKR